MGFDSKVKLFSADFSPFAQRVLIALREKGIPFELVEVGLPDKPEELLVANPIHKKVPTLVHNGKAVAESLVILEYLEDAWPQQVELLPKDAYLKSQMRFWADYTYQFTAKLIPNFFAKPDSPERVAADEITATGLKTLEDAMLSFSADGPFFAGDKFGFMDVILAPTMLLVKLQEHLCGLSVPDAQKMPRLHKWLEAVLVRPSVKDSLPDRETSIAAFNRIAERRKAAAAAAAK